MLEEIMLDCTDSETEQVEDPIGGHSGGAEPSPQAPIDYTAEAPADTDNTQSNEEQVEDPIASGPVDDHTGERTTTTHSRAPRPLPASN